MVPEPLVLKVDQSKTVSTVKLVSFEVNSTNKDEQS